MTPRALWPEENTLLYQIGLLNQGIFTSSALLIFGVLLFLKFPSLISEISTASLNLPPGVSILLLGASKK